MSHPSAAAKKPVRPTDSRQRSRHRLVLPARIELGSETLEAIVLDISSDGCLVEMQTAVRPGTALTIIVPQLGQLGFAAEVVWEGAAIFGCQFQSPLPAPLVDEARLRGAPLHARFDLDADAVDQLAVAIGSARRRAGLSATELARRTGVSRPTLWSWETGKSRPSPDNLLKLKEALAISQEANSPFPDAAPGQGDHATGPIDKIVERHRKALASELGVDSEQIQIKLVF